MESNTWLDDPKTVRRRYFDALVVVAIFLCLLVIVLPSIDMIIIDPTTRWAALIITVLAAGLLVLRQVALSENPAHARPSKRESPQSKGNLERLADSIEMGANGSSYAQMTALMDLRRAFRSKIMSTRGLSRDEFESLMGDVQALHRFVRDEDLERLMIMDMKKKFMVSQGGMDGAEFSVEILRLTKKLEEWR